jgi:hypothetical protein
MCRRPATGVSAFNMTAPIGSSHLWLRNGDAACQSKDRGDETKGEGASQQQFVAANNSIAITHDGHRRLKRQWRHDNTHAAYRDR